MSDEQECKCEAGAPKWVVTFGDMMSLLLCFFILMLSFSTTDVVKYRKLVGSLKDAFGVAETTPTAQIPSSEMIISQGVQFQPTMAVLFSIRSKARNMSKAKAQIEAEAGADWVRIKVEGDALFLPGSSEINPEAYPILNDIGDLINEFPGTVQIEGHTDSDLSTQASYLSHYQLAANRAIAVMDYMVRTKNADRQRLVPVSYGDAKPRETNDLEEGKARNRRVEFLFNGSSRLHVPGETLQPPP
ncbi:MAG: OmpA family protein [Acidobacteria bacterium]|nr:OmpA family protein [Acidobacteriota bacterium]MCB9396290.1 OmpA family protein [Acidobacteriota bacterium]